ncbi:MAG: hypothetical protein E6Z83_21395 [Pantoea sp.]|uniref:Prophage protein n=1 Tax=Pantoea septica TaxID=472695 RepID=A0ABX3UUN0_9GAMM|nr:MULTISPECIES: hypothetical protein [Pantoea]MDU5783331.1 hypothetical protein [Pantoea sp.]ORN01672.1 hypothetical protein HA46_05620 [Pantoea septica]
MSKSLSVTFRVPAELSEAFTDAVSAAGGDKTAWLVDAIRQKMSLPETNPNARLMSLVERMEVAAAALIIGKQGVPGLPYDEQEVIRIIAETINQGFDNGRIIAERLNDAGYQTKAGKAWTKDIYSAWKRQADHKAKVDAAMLRN